MSNGITPVTAEETLAYIGHLAKEDDSFRMRIECKQSPASLPELRATFDSCVLDHITSLESWVPELLGGTGQGDGCFIVKVYHTKDKSKLIGVPLQLRVKGLAPKPSPDFNSVQTIVGQSDWPGPKDVIHPRRATPIQTSQTGSQPQTVDFRQQPQGGQPGMIDHSAGQTPRQPDNPFGLSAEALFRKDKEIDNERRRLDMRELQIQNDAKERELNSKLAALDRKLEEIAKRPVVAPTVAEPKGKSDFAELASSLAPLLLKMEESKSAMALKQLEIQMEMAKLQMLASKESAESTRAMLQALTERGKNDPAMEGQAKMMTAMSEILSSSMQMQMNVMQAVHEMMGSGDDMPPWGKVILKAMETAGELIIKDKTGDVPPMHVKKEQKQIEKRAEQEPKREEKPAEATNGAAKNGAEKPAFADATPAKTPLEQIEDSIRAMADTNAVASTIIHNLQNGEASFAEALAKYGGNFGEMATARIGPWVMKDEDGRLPYIKDLMAKVKAKGTEAGVFKEEDEEIDIEEGEEEGQPSA